MSTFRISEGTRASSPLTLSSSPFAFGKRVTVRRKREHDQDQLLVEELAFATGARTLLAFLGRAQIMDAPVNDTTHGAHQEKP